MKTNQNETQVLQAEIIDLKREMHATEAEITAILEPRLDNLMECYIKLISLGVKPQDLPHPWADTGETVLLEVIEYLQEGRQNKRMCND